MAKKKNTEKEMPQQAAVLPPKVRIERGEFVVKRGKCRVQYKNNLDKYCQKGSITQAQYDAGAQLERDHMFGIQNAYRSPSDISKDFGCSKSSSADGTDYREHAAICFRNAMAAMNPSTAKVLMAIVIEDFSVGEFEKDGGYSRGHYGLSRLRDALDDLADYHKNRESRRARDA